MLSGFATPVGHSGEDRAHALASFGEGVANAGHGICADLSIHQPFGLEVADRLG